MDWSSIKLDRLTQVPGRLGRPDRRLFSEDAGRRLLCCREKIDTRTAAGRIVLDLLMTVAQWERRMIAERTADALQGKISRGERCGRIRFGYTLAADGKTLIPDPDQQRALAFMREWEAQGKTYREMVATLKSMGIDCKDPGSVWRPGAIHRILTRPIP